MQKLLTLIMAISSTLSDTVLSSLVWSGATRFVNAYGFKNVDEAVFLRLVNLVANIQSADLKPTTEQVLELLATAPVLEKPDANAIKALEAAGENLDAVTKTLAEEHNQAMARHSKQQHRVARDKKAITEALDDALAVEVAGKVGKMSTNLENVLILKIMDKVNARRSRLVVDITAGRYIDTASDELRAINTFLASQSDKKAA